MTIQHHVKWGSGMLALGGALAALVVTLLPISLGQPSQSENVLAATDSTAQSTTTGSTTTGLVALNPLPGSTLSGVQGLKIGGVSSVLSSLDLWFQVGCTSGSTSGTTETGSCNTFFTRSYNVADYRVPNTFDMLEIPLDTLAMPNGGLQIVVCPGSGSGTTLGCSTQVGYTIANHLAIQSPKTNQTLSGSAKLAVSVPRGDARWDVQFVTVKVFPATATSESQFVYRKDIFVRDTLSAFSVALDTTKYANGQYKVSASYWPYWQTWYGTSPVNVSIPFAIQNTTTTTTVNTNTAPTNTSPSSSGSSPTNTNTSSSTTTTTTTDEFSSTCMSGLSARSTSIGIPVIKTPADEARVYDVDRIAGVASGAHEVVICIGNMNDASQPTLADAYRTTVKSTGEFVQVLRNPLKPGSYRVGVAIVQDSKYYGEFAFADFLILSPRLLWKNVNSGYELGGKINLELQSFGRLSNVSLSAFTSEATNQLYIGSANLISGSSDTWTATVDTRLLPPGPIELQARGQGLDGVYTYSNRIQVSITADATADTLVPSDEPAESIEDQDMQTIEIGTEAPRETTPLLAVTPKTVSLPPDPSLSTSGVSNTTGEGQETKGITFSGVGPPNSLVTLYIYSNPIVVTTKTDDYGNWTYTLDQPLDNGEHEIYVTVTDTTGDIVAKGSPFSFFVAEARAVTEEDFRRTTAPAPAESDRLMSIFLLLGSLTILSTMTLILVFYHRHRPQLPNTVG